MQINLFFSLVKFRFLTIIMLLLGFVAFGQTLVTYNFTNNLNPTGADAGLTPLSLKYYDPVNEVTPPYYNNALRFAKSGDEVRFKFNGTNFGGLNVSFKSWAGAFGLGGIKINVKVYLKVGSGAETEIASQDNEADLIAWNEDPFSLNIPAANYQSDVQIRIVGTILSEWDLWGIVAKGFGIDQLVLTSNSPLIAPQGYNTSNILSSIAQNAPASTSYGTFFGIITTDDLANPNSATRVFRITNSGAAVLEISSITFSGDNPSDFSWVTSPATPAPSTPAATNAINSFPATINAGASRDFTVRFNPSADGKRSALLNISSNANPSPYSFYVEGRGSTCETTDLVLKSNTMETIQTGSSVLTATGTMNFISGNSQPNGHNPLNGTMLFPHSNSTSNNTANTYNLSTSSSRSWYIRNETSTVQFGPVDIANENGVYISFNVAAFSTATSTDFNNNDYVELQVLNPDTNDWSNELRISGNNNYTNENTRYSFDVGKTAETFYDGDNVYFDFQNGNGLSNKYSKVKLKLPGSANFQNLVFRIVAYNSSNQKLWLIDDVAVSSANVIQRKWNGSSWRDANNNPATDPNEAAKTYKNYKTIFEGNYTVPATNLTVCECEVKEGVTLNVPSETYLTVLTKITNHGDGDNITINNNANLIQLEEVTTNNNQGSATVKRNTTVDLNIVTNKYLFWSSPVEGQNMFTIFNSGTPGYVMSYNSNTDYYTTLSNPANSVAGKGYSVKTPNADGVAFKGKLNNGIINIALDDSPNANGNTWNLVGNPYPSSINLVSFYNDNSSSIDPSLYFWNNLTSSNTSQTGAGATTWVTFNASGTGTWSGNSGVTSINSASKSVRPGQGFLVKATGNSLQFKNGQRTSATASTLNRGTSTSSGKYWIEFETPSGFPYSTAITYGEGAVDEWDGFDSEFFGSGNSIYSLVDDRRLIIQGRKDFNEDDVVHVGLNSNESGSFKIHLSGTEGVFNEGTSIILKDKALGTETDLTQEDYIFDGVNGRSEGRFEIIYRHGTFLNTVAANNKKILVYRNGEIFVIESPEDVKQLTLYDMSGRMISQMNPNKKYVELSIPSEGLYLINIQTTDGRVYNKKLRY